MGAGTAIGAGQVGAYQSGDGAAVGGNRAAGGHSRTGPERRAIASQVETTTTTRATTRSNAKGGFMAVFSRANIPRIDKTESGQTGIIKASGAGRWAISDEEETDRGTSPLPHYQEV